jgi:mannose-1-phosphate guanylyltransferase / phosphomannomutase
MKAVIMAGGLGTRISSIASDVPKPMISICNKPILEYQIECLERNNIKEVIMVIGHLGEKIMNYFGDGSRWGVLIKYYIETQPLGTAGALYKIIDDLENDIILLNGDIVFDIDFSRLVQFHIRNTADATLVTHPNSHPYDSAIISTDCNNRIVKWINKEDKRLYYKNSINSGIHIITKKLLYDACYYLHSEKIDLDRDILKPNIASKNIYAYSTPEYIKDMGTPERFYQISSDIRNGLVKRKNLNNFQRAIFLDRDGTINTCNGFITKPDQLEIIDGTAEAIKIINNSGYLAIIITNQPVIARGDCSIEELNEIHNKLETDLGANGAYIDDIFFCPHHPDGGYSNERPEYKIICDCRKPKPGMLIEAKKKYNIDMGYSYMIGDSIIDVQAGLAAGCNVALLKSNKRPNNLPKDTIVYSNLIDFVHCTSFSY